jgi:hypothetical protein
MSYQDDDGETTDIHSDHDLTEAIQYFHAGADDNASANGSILSGYSGRVSRKITLRIRVAVEYDGPSLSDTGSLVSLEDYPKHGHGSISLSDPDPYDAFPLQEPDDDAVTISSHDTSGLQVNGGARLNQRDLSNRFSESFSIKEEEISLSESNLSTPNDHSGSQSTPFLTADTPPTSKGQVSYTASRKPSSATVNGGPEPEPDGVFERLRKFDSDPFGASQQSLPLDANERGAQWLRDQTDRAAWHSFTTPTPSSMTDHRVLHLTASDSESAGSSSMSGDLELQKDDKGKYYYKFTTESSSHLGSERDQSPRAAETALVPDEYRGDPRGISREAQPAEIETFGAGSSTGAGLIKRVSQVSHMTESGESSSSSGLRTRGARSNRLGKVAEAGDISPELLQAILESESQSGPQLVTDCSSCGDILESFRYVCTTCGEKTAYTRESLALARSLTSEPSPATDPFADPSDSSSDAGLGLYGAENAIYNGQLKETDIVDARSESSFATSSWASVDHFYSPKPHQAPEQPQSSSSAWPSLFKPHSQDDRPQNEFPLSTFKQKLKNGFKRGTYGNPSNNGNGKGKDVSIVPEPPNPGPSGALATLNPEWNSYQQQPSFGSQPTFHPSLPPRRPEVVIVGHGSNRSDSSGGSRSHTSRSNSVSMPTATEPGYELCSKCIATAGVVHAESALSSTATPTGTMASHSFSSMSSLGSSPHEGQHSPSNTLYAGAGPSMGGSTDWVSSGASSVSVPPPKKPKRKVQIRHAYLEKFWGVGGWQDVGK